MIDQGVVHKSDQAYPRMLLRHPYAPEKLFWRGNKALLNQQAIALVGSRQASEIGIQMAFLLARYFACCGYGIVSGLAYGIDKAAHVGALACPYGKTIAVLGSSFTSIYPKEHIALADEITVRNGLLLTEYDDNTYDPQRLAKRSYLQADLSLAVIPIQAGIHSGTRHACERAMATGKKLFIPHPVQEDVMSHPELYGLIRKLVNIAGTIPFEITPTNLYEVLLLLEEEKKK